MATQVSDASNKTRVRGGSSDDLAVIAQRAQAFTNASGTAIALSEGSLDEIICRARSGSSAPEVGTSLRVEGSFTGLCIQSGKELRCDDAETDTRVDSAAIRALGIRSMVVIPIKEEGRVVGVLAVFAPTAHAFTITHVAVLKTMADQIAALLQRERKTRDGGYAPEPLRAAPAPVAKPAAISAAPVVPPAVVIKPAASVAITKPLAPPPAPRPTLPAVPKVEPVRASVVAVAEEVVPVPRKTKKESEETREAKADYRSSFGTLDAVAAPGKRPGVNPLMIGAAVAVIAAVGGLSYFMLHKPAAPSLQVQQSSSPANNAAAGNAQAAQSSAFSSTSTITSPLPVTPTSGTSDTARKPEKTVARNTPPASQAKHEEPAAKQQETEPKREATVALSTGPSRIGSSKDNQSTASDAAPAVALDNVPASGNLSTLANPVSSSTPSMVAQSDLENVIATSKIPPVYPPVAKQRRLSGSVVVEGIVGTDGKITKLQLVSGQPIFRDAAFEAVKQWKFKPARLNGQPIEQSTRIRLDFNPQ
jgi:TonB family protein